MENYFVSNEFIAAISPLYNIINDKKNLENVIGYIIGSSLKYYMLFNGLNLFSTEKMNDFVNRIVSHAVSNKDELLHFNTDDLNNKVYGELLRDVMDQLNLSDKQIDNSIKLKLREIITLALERFDYRFHSFNGYFFDNIKENGIDPNLKEDQEEIKELDSIFKKYGAEMVLGWSKFDNNKVSYSKSPMVCYHYALSSPEWFSQFTGQSVYHKENKSSFSDNNYEEAKNNVMSLLTRYNVSEEESEKIMNFFEKSWVKYANQKQYVAIMEEPVPTDTLNLLLDIHKQNSYYNDDINKLLNVLFYSYSTDIKSEKKLDTSNAKYIELPKIKDLVYKLNDQNENKFHI